MWHERIFLNINSRWGGRSNAFVKCCVNRTLKLESPSKGHLLKISNFSGDCLCILLTPQLSITSGTDHSCGLNIAEYMSQCKGYIFHMVF
jgi:hypothetical protein